MSIRAGQRLLRGRDWVMVVRMELLLAAPVGMNSALVL
jgi:hypothetical protein